MTVLESNLILSSKFENKNNIISKNITYIYIYIFFFFFLLQESNIRMVIAAVSIIAKWKTA